MYMKNTDAHIFHVSLREVRGKKNKTLAAQGMIPANIFGLAEESTQISINLPKIAKHLNEEGDSGLVYLQFDEQKEIPVLINEVQNNVLTGQPIHVSFKRVNMKKKIVSEISLELSGTLDIDNATALLTQNILTVEALPADLPEGIVIDISKLTELGQGIFVKDLPIDLTKVTVLLSEEEQDQPIVIVKEVKEEVEPEPTEEVTDGATGESSEKNAATEKTGDSTEKSE
jgi:large subunit ribosomal protein L25